MITIVIILVIVIFILMYYAISQKQLVKIYKDALPYENNHFYELLETINKQRNKLEQTYKPGLSTIIIGYCRIYGKDIIPEDKNKLTFKKAIIFDTPLNINDHDTLMGVYYDEEYDIYRDSKSVLTGFHNGLEGLNYDKDMIHLSYDGATPLLREEQLEAILERLRTMFPDHKKPCPKN